MGRGAPKGRRGGERQFCAAGAARARRRLRGLRDRSAHLCAGDGSRRGRARGVGRGGSCAGERLARGAPADRGSVSTGHAVSLRTARAVRGGTARAAGRLRRFLRGGAACARRSCGQGFGLDGPCGVPADSAGRARGKQLPRGVPADSDRAATALARGNSFRAVIAPRALRPRPGKKWPATALCQSPAIFPASVCGRARGYVRACSCATGCSCPAASSF